MVCGIQLHSTRQGAPVRAELVAHLKAMLAALPGRDTDVDATWTDGVAYLGWRGDAPAPGGHGRRALSVDPGARLAVAASARLDERGALCDAEGVPHPERAGLADSDLVRRAYSRWGAGCPEHLLGDYAFAAWDARLRTLFCARDHIGARPLYYALTAEHVAFASDVNAVLEAPGVCAELDPAAVATHLVDGRRPFGPHTFFRAVRRLPAGHAMTVRNGEPRVRRWWRPEDTPPATVRDEDSLGEAFRELYARAVGARVRGDRPVGVHLSGGLDSSSTCVLAARELRRTGRRPLAFAWQPAPDGERHADEPGEHAAIEAVRRQEGLRVFWCSPTPGSIVSWLRRDVTRDGTCWISEDRVQRRAAEQGVRVLLSGWGGDEGVSFSGRGLYPQLLRDGRWLALWRELRAVSRYPRAAVLLRAVLPLVLPGPALVALELRRGRWRWPGRRRGFIHPAFARTVRLLPPPPRAAAGVRGAQLHALRRGHLGERIDGWAASGARHGLEYSYPLLDRRLLEFALGLPPEQFRRGRRGRWLMRRALDGVLPAGIRWNPSKRDPVRAGAVIGSLGEALAAVREVLHGRSAPPSRSRYVDVGRLLDALDPKRLRADPRRNARIANALRFLDF